MEQDSEENTGKTGKRRKEEDGEGWHRTKKYKTERRSIEQDGEGWHRTEKDRNDRTGRRSIELYGEV